MNICNILYNIILILKKNNIWIVMILLLIICILGVSLIKVKKYEIY